MTQSQPRMSSKVIQKDFNNRFEILKNQGHSPLKCVSSVFKTEMHLSICKRTPTTNKCIFVLILEFDLNLIISRKSIHKGKYLASHTLIQNLINKWCGEIVLRTSTIQVTKLVHMRIVPCFLSTRMGFETHSIKGMG